MCVCFAFVFYCACIFCVFLFVYPCVDTTSQLPSTLRCCPHLDLCTCDRPGSCGVDHLMLAAVDKRRSTWWLSTLLWQTYDAMATAQMLRCSKFWTTRQGQRQPRPRSSNSSRSQAGSSSQSAASARDSTIAATGATEQSSNRWRSSDKVQAAGVEHILSTSS